MRKFLKYENIFMFFTGFPFYTIGRFANEVCTGKNNLHGTCMVRGECADNGGVSAGGCSTITNQAVCCICKLI